MRLKCANGALGNVASVDVGRHQLVGGTPDTGRSIGAYIIFYKGRPIEHGTHVPVLVAQSSA